MTKVKKTIFKKGVSGNPKGKPKGILNKSTLRSAKLKTLASNKYEEAFRILWEAIEAKESWAHQIFFKDLVSKRVYQPTIVICQEDGVDRVEAITKALPQFEELTHGEAMDEIRTLKTAEPEEKQKESESIFTVMSDEQIKLVYEMHNSAKNNVKN